MSKYTKMTLTAAAALLLSAGGSWAEGYGSGSGSVSGSSSSAMSGQGQTGGNAMNGSSAGTSGRNGSATMNGSSTVPSDIEPQAGDATARTTLDPADLSVSDIQSIQTSLRNQGFNVNADGVWGPETASALRQFQQNNDLDASGALDMDTQSALNLNIGNGAVGTTMDNDMMGRGSMDVNR